MQFRSLFHFLKRKSVVIFIFKNATNPVFTGHFYIRYLLKKITSHPLRNDLFFIGLTLRFSQLLALQLLSIYFCWQYAHPYQLDLGID